MTASTARRTDRTSRSTTYDDGDEVDLGAGADTLKVLGGSGAGGDLSHATIDGGAGDDTLEMRSFGGDTIGDLDVDLAAGIEDVVAHGGGGRDRCRAEVRSGCER